MLPTPFVLAIGFVCGYFVGARHRRADALRREASAVLDSVGKLSTAGALNAIADLKVQSGNAQDGVQIALTTRKPGGGSSMSGYMTPGAQAELDA